MADETKPEVPTKARKAKAAKEPAPKRTAPKPKPRTAYPSVYAGDRVSIDGDEFVVRACHGQGRISLEGDGYPPTLWAPGEYEIVKGHADKETTDADA